MKKILAIIAFLFAVTSITKAQEIRFALKGGVNFGTVVWEKPPFKYVYTPKPAWYLGARLEYGLTQRMSIQTEILTQSYVGVDTDGIGDYDFSFFDITFPLVYKFYIIPQKLSANFGVSLGYGIQARETQNLIDGTTIDDDLKETDELNPFNFGINGGVEYRLNDNIFIDIRYNRGLSNLTTRDGETMAAHVIQTGVGWRF